MGSSGGIQLLSGAGKASRVIAADSSVVQIMPNTTEQTLFQYLIPAKTIDKDDRFRAHIYGSISSGLGVMPTVTLRVYYGPQVMTALVARLIAANLNREPWELDVVLCEDATPNSQYIRSRYEQDDGVGAVGGPISGQFSRAFFTVDASVNQLFRVTAQLSSAIAGVSLFREYAFLEELS